MKIRFQIIGTFALGVLTCVALTSTTSAQEDQEKDQIVIVNQDGETVAAAAIRIQGSVQGGGRAGGRVSGRGSGRASGGGSGGMKVQRNQDGSIVVTDQDGNQREIDIEGAQSIVVNQSVETVDNNGERQTKRVGKAVIIGPDGVRHEIDLGQGDDAGFNFPGFDGVVKAERTSNSFMIGVNCDPVSPALQAQLNLDENTGLVVVQVNPGSPAEAAGIVKHDILMFADDQTLSKKSDLSEVVQTAGKDKKKVSLTLIRAGKEIGIDVSPVERPGSTRIVEGMPNVFQFPNAGGPGGFKMQFRQMGPGVIIDEDFGGAIGDAFDNSEFHQDVEKQLDAMRKQMDALHQQMQKQREGNDIK